MTQRPWPRLLAQWNGQMLHAVHQQSDGRHAHASQQRVESVEQLQPALAHALARSRQPARHAALVVNLPVQAGQLGQDSSVERLRLSLALQTLLVLPREQAMAQALPLLLPAQMQWLLLPGEDGDRACAGSAPATAMVLCELADTRQATRLITGDGSLNTALRALLLHPLSPLDDDEALLAAQARREGRLLRLGDLLGLPGLLACHQALVRAEQEQQEEPADHEVQQPLHFGVSAEQLLSRAADDRLARRACGLACGALASLCAMLALAGAHSVLLGGAASQLQQVLRCYDWAPRMQRLLAGQAPLPGLALWAAPPERDQYGQHGQQDQRGQQEQPEQLALCLAGAATALASHWQAQAGRIVVAPRLHPQQSAGSSSADQLSAWVRSSYERLSRSERRVADLVLADAGAALRSPTAELARDAGVSQPQVIRFCRSLGFEGVKDFRRELGASLALSAQAAAQRL